MQRICAEDIDNLIRAGTEVYIKGEEIPGNSEYYPAQIIQKAVVIGKTHLPKTVVVQLAESTTREFCCIENLWRRSNPTGRNSEGTPKPKRRKLS